MLYLLFFICLIHKNMLLIHSMKSQQGQALTEYLLSLAVVALIAITGMRLVLHAIETQWDTLVFWLVLPSP